MRAVRSWSIALALVSCLAAAGGAEETRTATGAATPERLSRLQGRAYLDRRSDVIGATVLVRPSGDTGAAFLTSSDAKGNFHVSGLPDGSYRVELGREGLLPVVKEAVEMRFPFRAVVEVVMRPGEAPAAAQGEPPAEGAIADGSPGSFALHGKVLERDGGPLADVRVRVLPERGGADPYVESTAADGSFEIADTPAGIYRIDVTGLGYLPMRTRLVLTGDTSLDIAMVRQPADYAPSPLELMPREELIPPPSLELGATWE